MHGIFTEIFTDFGTAGRHLHMGKILSEGEMPPDSSQYQGTLAKRMNFVPGQSSSAYHPLEGSSSDGGGDTGGPSDVKRKKGNGVEGKSIEEELCRVCGDRASGYHYNALSCEGCKGFFRRSITHNRIYSCKDKGNCEMDMWMRRKCPACRLRRCREVGMKEECLLSEDQCKARDARRKEKNRRVSTKTEVHSTDSQGNPASEPDTGSLLSPCSADIKPPLMSFPSLASTSSGAGSPMSVEEDQKDIMSRLTSEQREIIEQLVVLQEKYEFADEKYYAESLKDFHWEATSSTDPQSFMHSMASTFVLITKLIVEFSKRLPGFISLLKEDQITLLKFSSTEVMSIRSARCYDLESQAIILGNGQPCTLENMKAASLGHYSELLYEFCHNMASYKTDNAEYALVTAICIFSERPGLMDKEKVENIQAMYVDLLQAYEMVKKGRGGKGLARFLSRLTDLRTISVEHSNVLVELDVKQDAPDVPRIIKDILLLPPEGN